MRPKHVTVPSSVRDQQYHPVDTAVALLEEQAPLNGLHVPDMRLGLDPDGHGSCSDRVPRAPISSDREWHFRKQAERAVQQPAEALEEREVGRVPERLTGREDASLKRETYGSAQPCEEHELHTRHQSAFD